MSSNIPLGSGHFGSGDILLDFIESLGLTYQVSAFRSTTASTRDYVVSIDWSDVRLRFATADFKSVSVRCFNLHGVLLHNWGIFDLTKKGKKLIQRQTEEFIRSLPQPPSKPKPPRKKS
jgi:hypothetical protein